MSTTTLSTSNKASSPFVLIPSQPTPFSPVGRVFMADLAVPVGRPCCLSIFSEHIDKQHGLHDSIYYGEQGSHGVDMDIAGTSSSLLRTGSQREVPRPWLNEDSDYGKTFIEQKITKEYIKNEDDALLRYPPNFTSGYPRGYLIPPRNSSISTYVCLLVHFGYFLTHPSASTFRFPPLSSFRRL